jgi:hypothetical protein
MQSKGAIWVFSPNEANKCERKQQLVKTTARSQEGDLRKRRDHSTGPSCCAVEAARQEAMAICGELARDIVGGLTPNSVFRQ